MALWEKDALIKKDKRDNKLWRNTCPECSGQLIKNMLTSYPPKYQDSCFRCKWRGEITDY